MHVFRRTVDVTSRYIFFRIGGKNERNGESMSWHIGSNVIRSRDIWACRNWLNELSTVHKGVDGIERAKTSIGFFLSSSFFQFLWNINLLKLYSIYYLVQSQGCWRRYINYTETIAVRRKVKIKLISFSRIKKFILNQRIVFYFY